MKSFDSSVERVLKKKLIEGDRDAFSAIFTIFYSDLVVFASSITHEPVISEEIVQEVFIKFWEEHEKCGNIVSLRSFFLKTVQNRCIDWSRHNKVHKKFAEEVLRNSLLYEYNTDKYLFRSELEEQIGKAILKLPPECSEAYRLSREEGLKYDEIAKKLNVSVRTIEVRIGKALHLLREYINDYLD